VQAEAIIWSGFRGIDIDCKDIGIIDHSVLIEDQVFPGVYSFIR